MRSIPCFTLGLFLLTARAEKEDFQGYFTEQTKGTTVTKDLLLKKENTIGHGTEAIPTEKTHQHTAMAVTAKFPAVVLFDTRPTQPYKKRQITKVSAVISLPSSKHFVSRNGQNSLTLKRESSAMRIDTESENPLISNYEKISLSSVKAAVESMMNDTSEPEVNLTADAVKAPPWIHTLLDYRNQRNTNSVKLTSADGGLGVPILSASHSRVIDNLAALHNDNDDKQSQGKGITNTGRSVYHFATIQSIFQRATAEDSMRGNTITNLCLTCLKDRRPVSTEKSVLSPHSSPDNNELTTSLTSLYQQSAGGQEEILNKDISHPNLTKHSSFSERGSLLYNQTLLSLSFNKTLNHSQSIFNDSQNNFVSSDTEVVAFHTRPLAEMSPETKKDTKKQSRHTYPSEASVTERPISTSTALYRSSESLYIVRKPEKSGEKELYGKQVSIGDPQSNLIYFSKNNKTASRGLSTNLKSFIQIQPLDISSGLVSNTPVIAEAPHSNHISPEGSDHSTVSHPTVRMSSTEAHSAATPFSESRPTTLPIRNPESHFLTGRVDSLISLLRHQTPAKPSFQTKEPILTLLPKDSAIKLASATTKTHLTDKQDPLTFNAVHSIVKQSFVYPPGPMNKPSMKEPQTTTTATREVFPGKLFLSESRQDFGDDMSVLTLPTVSSKSFSEKLTVSRFSGTQPEIIQGRTFDDISERNLAPTRQSYSTYNGDLIRESQRDYDAKKRDKNEQVLNTAAENGDQVIFKMEIHEEKKAIIKLQEAEKSRKDATLEYQRERFKESVNQERIINTGAKTNQSTDREGEEMAEHMANTSREKGGSTIGEEAVTLGQNQDPRQGEVIDEEDVERDSVTKIYEENSPKVVAEKQRESLKKKEAEARSEEAPGKEDNKYTGETRKEDVTNVPLGPAANLKKINRDTAHTVENLSSCHSLIKQLEATEHKGESVTPIVEIPNKSFTFKVTRNHRPTHSSLRYQSPNQSKTASLLKEPYAQIKSHLSPPRAVLPKHEVTSSLAKESAQNKVVEATFSATATSKLSHTFGDGTVKLRDILKPSVSPHSSAAKLAHPSLNSISNMLSLTTHRLTTTAGFLRVEPHFTVNSSTPNISIIYSIPDHRHKFSTSVSKGNSILHTTNESEQAEYIIPSVNPAPHQKMYNDSSTRPPTATALSSEAHISIGQLQPRQAQAAPQISQPSSSFDVTSGQPCSFKLSEQTAHPDALHTPVDDNEQRSVHTLMASLSPKVKSDQFPPTNMSSLLNLSLFGGDILPGAYSLTELPRSVSEKNLLKAESNTQYANNGSDHAESLLANSAETNQTKENENMLTMVTLKVKHLEPVTKKILETGDEKHTSPFMSQITGTSKDHNIDEFNSLSKLQTEKLAVKVTNENDPISVNGKDEASNAVTIPIKSVMFAVDTRPKIQQSTDDDFVYVVNAQSGTFPAVESGSQPKIQANDVINISSLDVKHHAANMTAKQNNSSTPQSTVSDSVLPARHINFRNDMTVFSKFTQQTDDQIVNVTSSLQIITTIPHDSVSMAPTIGGVTVSKDHESLLTDSESVPVAEKSSHTAAAAHMEQSNSHTEPLSLIGPPITPTTGKFTPAVKRQHTTETQSAELPEHKISVQAIEQSQHAPSAMFAITHNINDPGKGIQTGLLKTSNRAEGSHGPTSTVFRKMEYSSIKDIKTPLTTKSAFETKHTLLEKIFTVHTQDRTEQPDRQTSHEKTSISQLISGSVTDSVPLTGILPTEIINKISCRTIVCAQSTKATKTTTGAGEIDHSQKMYKTQGAVPERDHFSAEDTPGTNPENGNCSSDCPVPGKATPQATDLEYAALSTVISKSGHDHASVDETMSKKARGMTDKTVHLERHWTSERSQFVKKTTQRRFHRETSEAQEAPAKEVTLSEPEATALQTTIKATELTLLSEKNTKTQLNRGAGKAETSEAQNATRSVRAVAKEESRHRLLLPESESQLPKLKHRRRTSPHLHLSGITEVSEDLCGSGNYTAEMSLDLGRGVEPGDAVPARGNLRVVINLKTNNSQINLGVTSCCLSPTIQPDLANSTCCLFSRLAAEPAGITLLPTALSTSASFTISLFQMINYSVVYLHCDLSVCLRNHSDCERQCLQQRSALPLEGSQTIVTNLRNRISFGPMLKQVKNSTFPEEIDPSELDLVLVIVSLVVGSSLVTAMLLLVWLAYRKRGNWLLRSAGPPRACCGCLRPGGDLILP